ncbi:hypothetical protein VO54_02200 [Elizabethkingia miricola]|nr:hypothetical protein VO54_02200 [Elizabethkingia miricola]
MRKKILFAPLWGIFALSILSSCRTEDGVAQQKQNEAKYFKVFIPKKENETINYANGFAFLMKRYDELQKTNLSGINNKLIVNNLSASTEKNASVFQNANSYVEFNIRSEVFTEKNGDKWVAFPKIQGEKVTALVVSILTDKKTYVKYLTFGEQSHLYKVFGDDFQEAFSRYRKQLVNLRLSAAIKPIAGGEILIPEVIITVPRPGGDISLGPWGDDGGSQPGGGCGAHLQCDYMDGSGGGGGGGDTSSPSNEVDKIDITELQKYPCAFAVAQELPNLQNDLGTILNKIFKNSDKYNITFKAGTMPDADDGYTRSAPKKEADKFFATITLNEKMLNSATKEYILITMYHEVIHAYLGYELMQLGDTKFQEKYPMYLFYNDYDASGNVIRRFTFKENHNEFGSFMDTLTNVLTSYNSSKSPNNPLSAETIKAMVKGGITSLSQAEKDLNEREKGFNTQKYGNPNGTKCP